MSICAATQPADEKGMGEKKDFDEEDLGGKTSARKKAGPKRARLEVLAT